MMTLMIMGNEVDARRALFNKNLAPIFIEEVRNEAGVVRMTKAKVIETEANLDTTARWFLDAEPPADGADFAPGTLIGYAVNGTSVRAAVVVN